MQVSMQEYRHASLMAAVVAVVPLIFFPNDLGLSLNLTPLQFYLIELAYYGIILTIFVKGVGFKNLFMATSICFFSRLAVGAVFGLMAVAMYGTGLKQALAAGLFHYMPAMLLQVISFPFIMMPILKAGFEIQSRKKPEFVQQGAEKPEEEPVRPAINPTNLAGRKIIGLSALQVEKPGANFDDPLKYVGELSVVRFAVLTDSAGLPISFYGDNLSLRNLWSAISIYLIDRIKEPLKRAGDFKMEGCELTLDLYRLHIVQIESLYLLVAADKDSDETEKVRIAQAAEMIRRIYQSRYKKQAGTAAREENHVPSFS